MENNDRESESPGAIGMNAATPLIRESERIVSETIGCAIAVHKALGPGFLESIYKKAMQIEMHARGLRFETERAVRVQYRGITIPGQRIDLIVENLVVLELKSVIRLDRIHTAQVISYLKTTRLRVGLLINFRVPILRLGLRRIVL